LRIATVACRCWRRWSEIAGRLAAQAGDYFLQDPLGGRGVLIGGVPGVAPVRVTVPGGGVVGTHATRIACGMGADVTILDRSLPRLRGLDERFEERARVVMSSAAQIEGAGDPVRRCDRGGPRSGRRGTMLVTRDSSTCCPQGQSLSTSRSTGAAVSRPPGGRRSRSQPTRSTASCYCAANLPGAVPRTSTRAVTNATLPYVKALAERGLDGLAQDPGVAPGVNVRAGEIVSAPVAAAFAIPVSAWRNVPQHERHHGPRVPQSRLTANSSTASTAPPATS
jgi:alanine dehydrogenase